MFDIFRLIADFWWLAPIAGAGVVAYRYLGWRGLLAVVTLGAAGGLYTKGKRDERNRMEREAEAKRSKAIGERKTVDDQVRKDGPNVARDNLRRRLPDDKPR